MHPKLALPAMPSSALLPSFLRFMVGSGFLCSGRTI